MNQDFSIANFTQGEFPSLHSLAFYSLPFILLLVGSHLHPKLQFIVRFFLTSVCTIFFSAYGTIVAIIFTLLGRRGEINWATARSYAYITAPLVGISFKVEGEEYLTSVQPAIYVCNHQAAIDLMILGRVFPKNCVVVGKRELKYIPFLGAFMQLGGGIFLDRENHGNAMRSFSKAAQDIKQRKVSVWIFPEGTRGHLTEADLLPFKKGAFHLAVQAGIPIIPIVVGNYSEIYDSKRHIFKGGVLHIKALPPIPTEGINQENKEHINELTNKTRQIMLDTLREISPKKSGISTKVEKALANGGASSR